jgi:hypothetical protein
MEAERLIKDYEHEKHQERKRRGAHLEAIFEQTVKKSSRDSYENGNKDKSNPGNEELASRSSSESTYENAGQSSANSRNSSGNSGNNSGNVVSSHEDAGNPIAIPRRSPGRGASPSGDTGNALKETRNGIRIEHSRAISCVSSRQLEKANNSSLSRGVSYDHEPTSRESGRESPKREVEGSEGSNYTGFRQVNGSDTRMSSAKESKSSEFQPTVTIKQEKTDEPPQVQIMAVPSQIEREKSSAEDNGEIGGDCLKFLLFSGNLYHCDRISDLTQSFSRFVGDSVLGRKGNTLCKYSDSMGSFRTRT